MLIKDGAPTSEKMVYQQVKETKKLSSGQSILKEMDDFVDESCNLFYKYKDDKIDNGLKLHCRSFYENGKTFF